MKSEIANPSKRKKTHEQQSVHDEVDFLSMLPDDIIVSSLSLLTITEAARSSVLGVRWRYLWTYYFGSLHLDASLVIHDLTNIYLWSCKLKKERFKRMVDQVLNSLQTQTLESFEIGFDLGTNDSYVVDNWVQFAIQKKVKKLDLNTLNYTCCDVPSLLKLSSLPSLQVLRLSYVDVSGEDLEYLLYSCPSLQTLSVVCSDRLESFIVCSHAKIKELEIRLCYYLKTIEISSENLMSFTYYGPYVSINYEHIPNLKEVCFGGVWADRFLCNFFHLTIYDPSSYLKVLKLDSCIGISNDYRISNLWLDYELPENMILANLQHLEMTSYGMEQHVYDFCVFLMNRCPSLCSLTLKVEFDMDLPLRFETKHAYDCLEEVKLVGFSAQILEIRFIKYIIENASNLKEATS